ncbi:MAG: DUF3347 domain-containing protein [Bacteroidota bacterium]|nr:DUF3347 domain-containing protein [Bacteroidota bacterium]
MKQSSQLQKQIELLIKAKGIEEQREIFSLLSNQIIESVETFGLKIDNVYVAYCPMALNDQGAYWLSEFEEIHNPYFGEKMLKCGEVKKTIKAKGTQKQKTNQQQGHQH